MTLNALADLVETEYDLSHGSVIVGDTLSVLPDLPENEFHAIVTDPPYNFEDGFMQEDWDDVGTPTEYQQWCKEWAQKALHTLKPGGHLIAFSGNRSHHRLMCGVEDAGYEIRDTITWHYGNGFPKGPRIERWLDEEYKDQFGQWRGMLKPATEFAVLARAPLDGTSSTKNQMEHGTGNLNVEACRIGSETMKYKKTGGNTGVYHEIDEQYDEDTYEGRFPPNVALDSVMADVMDLQSGERQGGNAGGQYEHDDGAVYGEQREGGGGDTSYEDCGGASRFFYCSKAAKSERTMDGDVENDHPTVKPVDLMEWLVKMVTAEEQKVLDPFVGSGTTLLAADNVDRHAVGIEMSEDYAEITRERFDANQS